MAWGRGVTRARIAPSRSSLRAAPQCFLPCGDCAKLRFDIFRGNDVGHTTPVGYIARVWPGCIKALATDADNYVIEFPADASPVQRACLSAGEERSVRVWTAARGRGQATASGPTPTVPTPSPCSTVPILIDFTMFYEVSARRGLGSSWAATPVTRT